jgi:acetate---CoA ligase (ADP-forming)
VRALLFYSNKSGINGAVRIMAPGTFRDLSPLLNPKRIAVVGASERAGSAGRLVIENLQRLNYSGEVYAVNPKVEQVLGYRCYPSLEALPGPVDMAAILLGADKLLPTLETMTELGIPAAWALASGFGEAGPEGKKLQAKVTEYARANNLLLCGPNCVGLANMLDGSATYSVALSPRTSAGSVSAVMQSGAILMGLANSAPFGFRYLISSGNEAVLDSADYIGYLASDPKTKVIIAFLEGIRDAGKFVSAARAAFEAGKPVLVVKVGRSEAAQRAVQAHTGSLAGADNVLDSVFEREKIIRLDSLDELVETTRLFMTCPLPENDKIGLLSLSGGQIGLLSDLAQGLDLNFPALSEDTVQQLQQILPAFTTIANPLDAWGTGDLEKMYPSCVAAMSKDPSIGLIAMSRDTPPGVAQREIDQSLRVAEAAVRAKQETGKPVLLFSNISSGLDPQVVEMLAGHEIPYLQGTHETLRAIEAFERYATFRRRADKPVDKECSSPANLEEWRKRLQDRGSELNEIEGRQLLAEYGITGPREATAADEDTAAKLATEIGFPVVLKILSPDIQHKTEMGGVRVGLKDEGAVRAAFCEVMDAARRFKPDAQLKGVILQEMIPSESVEVILGILNDPSFGPVVVFGSGGILVELVKDSVVELAPFSRQRAFQMIERIRGKKLLHGYRGRPAADIDALADTLVRLSQLAVDFRDQITALEINPLMVLPSGKGVRAVDALCELKDNKSKRTKNA